jgi:hypothetical protein
MSRQGRSVALIMALVVACGGRDETHVAAPASVSRQTDVALRSQTVQSAPETPHIPPLDWQPCADGFECATALLPRDDARPRAGRLAVAVTRLPVRDRERRIGRLFVNFRRARR